MATTTSKTGARVAALIRETMALKGVRYCDLPIAGTTLNRSLKGGNIKLTTLEHLADLLGCDVVIHFRQRPAAAKENHHA